MLSETYKICGISIISITNRPTYITLHYSYNVFVDDS